MPKKPTDLQADAEAAAHQEDKARVEREAIVRAQESRTENEAVAMEGDVLVQLPGGRRAKASEFLSHKYSSVDALEAKFLGDPVQFIEKPDPNYEYWLPFAEDDQTQSFILGGYYMPVKASEMKKTAYAPTHVGTDDFVHWKGHVLVKVRKDYAEAQRGLPSQRAIQNLVGAHQKF